jgi:hypothetical protein
VNCRRGFLPLSLIGLLLCRHSTPGVVWPLRQVQGQPESLLISRPFTLTSGWAIQILSNGDHEPAPKYLDEAYEVNQQINSSEMESVLTGQAILCMLRGEYGQARAILQKNIDDLEKMGKRVRYLWGRARLGQVALLEGSVAEAQQILVETTENFHRDQNKSGVAFALDKMASLYVVTDKPEAAARLIGWSDANRKKNCRPAPAHRASRSRSGYCHHPGKDRC